MSETVQYTLALNTELFESEFTKLEISVVRIMRYVTTLSGSPSLSRAITIFQKAIITARTLTMAFQALTAASGGWGLLVAGTSFLVGTLAAADITTDIVGYD